ncbi:RagB/SusD family nutrient uptake outer membrane protein [Puteibacter caeruleilacunae]|nr:RagB/SusD family nutrient uptake outer membrane protein [Puteibacter caeruleilacunae]
MKIYKILCMGLLLAMVVACEDELDKVDLNGQNSDTYMQYASQVKDAVTAVYDPLSYSGLYNWSFIVLGEAPTDNINNPWGDGRYGPDLVSIHLYNWDNTNQYFGNRWNACYKGIVRANYVLGNIDKAEDLEEGLYNQYVGEALFLRALYHYNLVIGYGDVPLVTSILSPEQANSITKSPAVEVWAQIDKDLSDAANFLPEAYSDEEDTGRATKGSAYGLLSRVRLWTKDYAGAVTAASKLEGLGYDLVSTEDFVHLFDGVKQNSVESVFEVQFTGGFGAYWNAEKAETTILQHIYPRISWGQYLLPRKVDGYNILDQFEDGDIRRQGSILIAGKDSIYYPKAEKKSIFPDLSIYPDFRTDLQEEGALQTRKFLYHDPEYWRPGGGFFSVGSSVNVPVIRYAEVILNKAEALVEQGKTAEAWDELKKIRDRAGLKMDGISKNDNSELKVQIKKDRRIELLFEGHRWGDLKRWEELNTLVDAGLNYQDKYKNWPIPSNEVSINPNLK